MSDIENKEPNEIMANKVSFRNRSTNWLVKFSLFLLMLDYIIDFRSLSTSFNYGKYGISLGFNRSVQVAATMGLLCPEFNGGPKLCTTVCIVSSLLSSDISIIAW